MVSKIKCVLTLVGQLHSVIHIETKKADHSETICQRCEAEINFLQGFSEVAHD